MSKDNLVPEGYYDAVCVPSTYEENGAVCSARLSTTKNNTKQVAATFEILIGPYAGRRLVWFGYFTKDTAKRTVESLRYMGLKGDDLDACQVQTLDQRVSIKVGHNEYDGKTTARVDFVNQPGGGGLKLTAPMSKDAARAFAAMMTASLKKVPEVAGEKVVPSVPLATREPGEDAEEEDDLPF